MKKCIVNFVCFLGTALGARILVVDPIGTKSHHNSFVPLLSALASANHDITVLTFMKLGLKTTNVNEIIVNGTAEASFQMLPNFFEVKDEAFSDLKELIRFLYIQYDVTELFYEDKSVQAAISEDYDLVIFSMLLVDVFAPIATTKNTPFVVISPNVLFEVYARFFGVKTYSAVVPNMLLSVLPPMTFLQRTGNMLINEIYDVVVRIMFRVYDPLVRRSFPGMMPLEEHLFDASGIFINTHPATAYNMPYPPGIFQIGGIHCRPAVPLKKELEEFIEDGDDGFVLLSLGSTIPISTVPAEKRAAIFSVFSRLSQKVFIKWEGEIPEDVPKNIMLLKWAPQQDLLGHPKMRLFITHGGLYSLQEAIFHSTPVLGIPVGNDQGQNLARAESEGYAKVLLWEDLNEEAFGQAINEVLVNQSYKINARRLSILFRDQPETPLQRAVYWIEYIIRHKGAPHLRYPGRELTWYQRSLLDVFLFLGAVSCLVVMIIYFFAKLAMKFLMPRKADIEKKKN